MTELNDPESNINKIISTSFEPEVVPFGEHKGKPWARVPLHWLYYLKEQFHPESAEYLMAAKELKRRGKINHSVFVTQHAIDRFSVYLPEWEKLKKHDKEGIVSVLVRIAGDHGYLKEGRDIKHVMGMKFVYENKDGRITLITVSGREVKSNTVSNTVGGIYVTKTKEEI